MFMKRYANKTTNTSLSELDTKVSSTNYKWERIKKTGDDKQASCSMYNRTYNVFNYLIKSRYPTD